jgi:DNA-binding HxlR family transcriptional regulator
MRAGAHVLLIAANPVHRGILRVVSERRDAIDGGLYEIGPERREALFVGFVVERWLQDAPQRPIDFDSDEAQRAVAALAEGWSATVVHALARGPLTSRELSRETPGLGHRALRRQLAAMQRAGQVEARADSGEGIAYALTDWLRAGLAPLVAAARVERRRRTEAATPIDPLDVEAAFQLALPLLELPRELSGSCRLGVNLDQEGRPGLTGVTAGVDRGRVVSCTRGLAERADAWAAAPAGDWLDTVIEPDAERVRTGGDKWLAAALLDALHRTLFGVPVR